VRGEVKKSHERFGQIIREHFDNVESSEFKACLFEASHGAFGEPAPADTEAPLPSKLKRAMTRVKRVAPQTTDN
jgi:hypothetical protein